MPRKPFQPQKGHAKNFERQLRRVARNVNDLISGYIDDGDVTNPEAMQKSLNAYSKALEPWAKAVTGKVLASLNKASEQEWNRQTKSLSKGLKAQTATGGKVGKAIRDLQRQQVTLIKSIPTQAGERVQELALKAVVAGTRSDAIRDEILRNNEVTLNRATLIARTETAKAVSNLTQARAEQAGVTHYVWRTMEDEAVRSSHAELGGKVFAFNAPPFIEGEGNHHPGDFPNCRCYAEPIIE